MALTSFIRAFLPLVSEGILNAHMHMQKHMAFALPRAPPGLGLCHPKCGGFHCKAAEKGQADNRSHLRLLCRKLTETK